MGAILRLSDNTTPAGNQFSTSSAENTFASVFPLPTNTDTPQRAGRLYKLKGFGYLSSASSTPGSLTIRIKWGSNTLGTATISTMPSSLSNAGFIIEAFILVGTTGTSGLIGCQGFVTLDNSNTPVSAGIVNTGTGTSGYITINTETAANLGISQQFSSNSSSNIITLSQLIIEEME